MKKRRIPGLALAVVQNGKIARMKAYGLANLEYDVPATTDTVFEIASLTKQFTATAVMVLVEEGKIKLEDPISKYLPESPDKWKAITIRHLLTHTSGLGGFTALYEGGGRLNYSTAQMFEVAAKLPLNFAAGEDWNYSDINYFLLGMIIEKVGGQTYRDFLTARFFTPLGMNSTFILDQWAIVKNRAVNYTLRNNQLVNSRRVWQFELPSFVGVLSTVKDLAKWEIALATGKIIKEESLKQMWTPVKFNDGSVYTYGFGWEIGDRIGHRMITHKGITGVEYTRFPDDKLTVIVLTNLGDRVAEKPEVNSWNLTKGVAGHFMPDLLFSSLKEQPGVNQQLTQKLKDFLSALASGEDSPLMTAGLKAVLGAGAKANTARRLKELKSFTFLRCDDRQKQVLERNDGRIIRSCYYKMITGTETFYYTFWLTSDDKLADFTSSIE
ncbi:MAG: beta-lactamase family protein [Acidobacteriota bacterium]|nr:beta-lactamase family protein [Acidobacteriota bacterium]